MFHLNAILRASRPQCILTIPNARWMSKRATASTATTTRTRKQNPLKDLSNLDPAKLSHRNHVDLSNQRWPRFRVLSSFTQYPPIRLTYCNVENEKSVPFPDDTSGFFYFYSPIDLPMTAGEIRFRVTSSNDPSAFIDGRDLLRPPGVPWSIPLLLIAGHDTYLPLRMILLENKLVSIALMQECRDIYQQGKIGLRSTVLHAIHQPFDINLSNSALILWTVGQGTCAMFRVDHIFEVFRDGIRTKSYSGIVLARFEKSTLPEHIGTRTLVLRIIKILQPIQQLVPSPMIDMPVADSLVSRSGKTWSLNIDKTGKNRKGFASLFGP